MSIFQDIYPGDRVVEFSLIVALGVMALSAVAWCVGMRLRRKPAVRHLVLIAALFGCLAMPVMAAIFSASGLTLIALPLLPAPPSEAELRIATGGPMSRPRLASDGPGVQVDVPRAAIPLPLVNTQGSVVASTPLDRPGPARGVAQPPLAQRRAARPVSYRAAATLILIVWACGSAFLLLRLARSWLIVDRIRRTSIAVADASVLEHLAMLGRALSCRKAPRVVVSQSVRAPLAFGFLSPIIVLPDRLIGAIDDDEMRDVLLHEMAHLKRRDPLIVLLQELARALYWPIVPVHGLIAELGRAREELCDNHVLAGRDALSYGETLLHLAELSQEARPLVAAVGIMYWNGELERRIAGLLDQGRSRMTKTNRWLVGVVASLFIAGGTIASATRLSAGGPQKTEASSKSGAQREAQAGPGEKSQEKPRRTMLVHTLGPDGRPMAGVAIHRSVWTRKPIKDANRDFVSDGRGPVAVDLPEGMYIFRLWARTNGHVPLFAGWEEHEKPETSVPAEFTFRLQPGTTIGGVVRDSEGQPIKGVVVEVRLEKGGKRDGRAGPDGLLAEFDPTTHKGTAPVTDEHGKWALDNVPAGDDLELRLKLSHPDYVSDPQWGSLQDQQGIDLKMLRAGTAAITMRGGIVATGIVRDAEGKPIAGAVVVRGDHPYWDEGSQEVRTDLEGRYALPPLPSGKVTVTAIAPGWMPALVKADIRQGMGPVNFQLRPGKDLRLRIVDEAGKPIAGVSVALAKWRGGESLYNHKHANVLDTRIPVETDGSGVYRWTWAPDDGVTYTLWKEGHVRHEVVVTASASEQTVTLPKLLRLSGKVTDRGGRPIKGVTAIPVLEFGPGHLLVERNKAKGPFDGKFALETDRTDVSYRVRVEAPGYRSAMSGVARAGVTAPTFDFQLEEAPPVEGRLVDSGGSPVAGASVYLATHSQNLNDWPEENRVGSINQKVVTDKAGRFSLPAQFEKFALIAVADGGYAEVHLEPDQQPGDVAVKAWAQVEGRLMHAGRPIPAAWVSFSPVRVLNETLPHIQDHFSVKTDRDGRFVFPRVPPVKSHVRAQLSVWRDYPFRSSRSVPLDLRPGEKAQVDLGGEGTLVKGRVVLSGDAAQAIDLHKSLNWLCRREAGIEPPAEVLATGLSARNGWNNAWRSTREGLAFIDTLHTHFVVLDAQGRFEISGVPAGDYDLAFRLYEPPGEGCLVSPVGSRIVRVQVTANAAPGSSLDLGEIPVSVAIGPRVGDVAPDFNADNLAGGTVALSSMKGRYVLLDFWATWCAPCVATLPAVKRIHDTFGAGSRVAVLGLNLDDQPALATAFVAKHKLSWTQGYLGGRGGDNDDVLSKYAISFIPTYILIGPDGKLVHRSDNLDEVTEALRRALE